MSTNFAARVLGPDTHANRPSAATVPEGALYSCTDHNIVYVNRSSTWGDWVTAATGGGVTLSQGGPISQSFWYPNSSGTMASIVLTKPAMWGYNVAAGDLLLAFIGAFDDATVPSPPSGWTQQRRDFVASGGGGFIFSMTAGGSEPADYTFTFGAAERACGVLVAIRGATGPTVDQSNGTAASTLTPTAPAITPGTGATLLFTQYVVRTAFRHLTIPAGMTGVNYQSTVDTTNGVSHLVCMETVTAGVSTGTRVSTASGAASSHSGCAQSITIAPV